jgi:voltage-gated sodium channel type II alpha
LTNTITLMLQWYGQSVVLTYDLDTLNYVFAWIFTGEFVFKVIAYGYRYFRDPWSVFDCVIVVITVASIILS